MSSTTADYSACPTCAGCGLVANDEDRTPWKYWTELPLRNALAVLFGIVQPVACPDCGGTGCAIDKTADRPTEPR